MNKIDDFFKKRLDVDASQNEGWNMPSDDLWNAALPHFPKEEKKRKSFFWFWLSVGLLFSVSMTYLIVNNNEAVSDNQPQIANTKETYHEDILKDSKTIEIEEGIKQESEDQILVQKELVEKPISEPIAESNSNMDVRKSSLLLEDSNQSQNSKGRITRSKSINDNNDQDVILRSTPNNILSSAIASNSELGVQDSKNKVVEFALESTDSKIEDVNVVVKTELGVAQQAREEVSIGNLRDLDLVAESNRSSIVVNNVNSGFIQPKLEVRPMKEIGVSSQLFFLNLLEGVNLDDSEDGTVVFDGRFRNLNFKYAKWIGRKWSISTGINFADLALNLDIDTDIVYDEVEFGQDINSQYGEVINSDNIGNAATPVMFKSGVELVNGDVVRLRGNVDLGLRVIQVPIILNYHWYNKRFEFYTGLGFALESAWAREENANFNIFENDILITEPSSPSDFYEQYFSYSYYVKLGTKFNFNKQINFDTALNILANDIIFSSVEFGLHYRWHK